MSDRPTGYGWLYDGDANDPAAGAAGDPNATRPVQVTRPVPPPAPPAPPRAQDSAYPAPPRIAPEPGREQPSSRESVTEYGRAPGVPRTPRPPRPPRTRSGTGRKIRLTLLGVVVLALIWGGLECWAGLGAWHSVHKVAWEPNSRRPAEAGGTTYLMVGSDSRAGLTRKQRVEYHTGDDGGQRTDTIMLVHTGGGHSLVMSIPRDSLVDIPNHGNTKINAAFAYGGAKLLVRTIEQDTGIRIDQYVEIGMGGVANMVDAVGGITICPSHDMVDPLAGLNVKKGCQPANGRVALAYARSRHAQTFGDLDRAKDQRQVITAVMHKLKSPAIVLNPFRLHHVGSAVGKGLTVGKGMSVFSAYQLYGALKALTDGKAKSCGTPISDWAVHWDPARSQQLFSYIKHNDVGSIPKSLCTPTGFAK